MQKFWILNKWVTRNTVNCQCLPKSARDSCESSHAVCICKLYGRQLQNLYKLGFDITTSSIEFHCNIIYFSPPNSSSSFAHRRPINEILILLYMNMPPDKPSSPPSTHHCEREHWTMLKISGMLLNNSSSGFIFYILISSHWQFWNCFNSTQSHLQTEINSWWTPTMEVKLSINAMTDDENPPIRAPCIDQQADNLMHTTRLTMRPNLQICTISCTHGYSAHIMQM